MADTPVEFYGYLAGRFDGLGYFCQHVGVDSRSAAEHVGADVARTLVN